MGLFGIGNYNKPGPGVEKDEPQKSAPARYFEVLFRKLTKLIQVNLLFFVPFLIALVIAFLLYTIPFPYRGLQLTTATGTIALDIWLMYVCPIPFIFVSPFISGLTKITRNFAREEHAFIWHDFITTTKSNIKQSLQNGVIVYVAYVVFSFSIIYYFTKLNDGWFYYIPLAICLIFALIFIFCQYYVPTMIITFDLKLKQIYKNAFIFSALGIWRNILLTLAGAALIVVILYAPIQFVILGLIVLGLLLIFSLCSFTVNFATYPIIKKYLIDPYNKQQEEIANPEGVSLSEKVSEPESFNDDDDDDPDGVVYVNGRLIKKSELENKNR